MAVRALFAPLVSGSTYRRAVHLLLGGVVLLPYLLLGYMFATLLSTDPQPLITALLLAVAAVIAAAPAFLRGTRTLSTVAARSLLDVDLPHLPNGRLALEARLRSALWFATHLLVGGVVAAALIIIVPMALMFLTAQLGPAGESFRFGPFDADDQAVLSLLGFLALVGLTYAVAGLGRLAAVMAPVLLGPTPEERIAALEAEAGELAERNRLARELHDSVGHALTVATLQAAAAREVLSADPEFARRALAAIEDTGRAAMADLDHVLGLLRDGQPSDQVPARTLANLTELLAAARSAGTEITVDIAGEPTEVPGIVSREAYRVVQECLTNATRHAHGEPVTLQITVTESTVGITATNPVRGEQASRAGGRGITGMRERVRLLGGKMTAGREEGRWRVNVRLPLGGKRWGPT
ncbi:MAG: two-component sensor histidine kinase [Streptosporangiales bacterium]|nr:two-component sensor histidine kinase [Streptosporangiales bacterium]